MQPGEAVLDHPALSTQTRSVGDAAAGDAWGDPASAQLAAVDVVVMASVGAEVPRASAGTAAPSADRWSGVEQRQEGTAATSVDTRSAGSCPAERMSLCPRSS